MRNFLPPDTVNHISDCTRDQEIEIARSIGGRLPFDPFENLVWRGIIPYPDNYNPCKNRMPAKRTGRKKNIMNNSETNNSTNPTNESINDKRLNLSTLPNHNPLLSLKEAGSA